MAIANDREAGPMSGQGTSGAVRRRLDDRRWHFQHGPIDCIVAADGDAHAVAAAVERAWSRFQPLLAELAAELPLLRADLRAPPGQSLSPRGPVARRMVAACRPHAADGRFITAMAAVAGSVAEELIAAFDDPAIARAAVNNGGDIALCLRPEASFAIGVCADPLRGRFATPLDGRFAIDAASAIRGIATSGWRGRSFSLGIADSVTILASSASAADAAATIVANAVDVDDARIVRAPASALRDDSDLGDRLVTRNVPPLPAALVALALARGVAEARAQVAADRIVAAVLSLQGRWSVVGEVAAALPANATSTSSTPPVHALVRTDDAHALLPC
ncbi:MAG TPA: UPF0280 family protein [Caldimonas sp.]|nr:UPF0280 family protein [Caldimonas sp.]HEX4233094.1 UPF0280 family protein [Caldimonas sp.]